MHTGPSLVKVVEVVAFLSSIFALMGSSVQKWGTAGGHVGIGLSSHSSGVCVLLARTRIQSPTLCRYA